jgi:hypothetical protein
MTDQHKYRAVVQWQQGKPEVLGEQPDSVPLSWCYLYGYKLFKLGVIIWSLENKIIYMVSGYMKITGGADTHDKCSPYVPIP